jgi:hypothetical protein
MNEEIKNKKNEDSLIKNVLIYLNNVILHISIISLHNPYYSYIQHIIHVKVLIVYN